MVFKPLIKSTFFRDDMEHIIIHIKHARMRFSARLFHGIAVSGEMSNASYKTVKKLIRL